MSSHHQEVLKSYKDVSSVYSYGYGALRQLFSQLRDGTLSEAEVIIRSSETVAAVEFRVAELGADVLASQLKYSQGTVYTPQSNAPADAKPIYVSDENAAERPIEE